MTPKITLAENLVWTFTLTCINEDTFYLYADEKLVARMEDCEDSYEAMQRVGRMIDEGEIDFSIDLREEDEKEYKG